MLRFILNIIWLVLCGFWMAIALRIAGMICFVLFILIITIPFGIASFRIAGYALWPFGRTIDARAIARASASLIGNVIWFILVGCGSRSGTWSPASLLCITIIGIPLGLANFKMIPISLVPLGVRVVPSGQLYPGYR